MEASQQRSVSTVSMLNRVPRHHAAWDAFVSSISAEMDEAEALTLTIATVKSLAVYNGFNSPLDIAHIELAWGERQNQMFVEEEKEPEVQEPVVEAPKAARTPLKTAGKKAVARPTSATASKTPAKKPVAAANGASPKPTTPKGASSVPPKTLSPRGVSFTGQRENSGDPNGKIIRKDTGSRIDTGAVRRATSYEDEEVICVEDVKDVFRRYAAYANGNMKELDGSRFSKMIREADLIDKLFTLREADVLFTKCKKSSADRRIPYHVFRMKLLPEMAAKKHTAIAEIIKMLNHHGGPEIKQRVVQQVAEPEYEEEYEEEAPPPPPAPVVRKAGSASRTPTKVPAKVPPLRRVK